MRSPLCLDQARGTAPFPLLIHKWYRGTHKLTNVYETGVADCNVVETMLSKLYETIDLTLLDRLVYLILDHNLANYTTAKDNTVLADKGMAHANTYCLVHNLQ